MCIVSDFFFFKQKTAYEMRISDWSSDVCSSDLDIENKRRPDLAASSDPDDASVSRSSIVRCQRFSRLDLNFCPAPHRALNIVSPYRLAIRPFWVRPMPFLPHSSFFRHSSVRIRTVSPTSRNWRKGAHAAIIGG